MENDESTCSKEPFKKGKGYLDERHSHHVLLDVVFDGVAYPHNELVRDHEDQNIRSLHRLRQVWNSPLSRRPTKERETQQARTERDV